jgi:FAD/FMN-containing dehydrogenase
LAAGNPALAANRNGASAVLGRGPKECDNAEFKTIGPDAEPDLFWALRGGNFGVVTSMRVRLHPARDMLAGSIVYDRNEAAAVLRRYAAFAATAPDEFGSYAGMLPGPDGKPIVIVVALWNGDRRRGEGVMEEVQAFGAPQSAQVGPANYADTLAQFDAGVPG